jgi:hypothetical protein
MGLTTAGSIGYGHKGANRPLDAHSSGAHVRIHSGNLHGMEGTVLSLRGSDRLLISPLDIRGVCVEIDARMVEYVDGPSR